MNIAMNPPPAAAGSTASSTSSVPPAPASVPVCGEVSAGRGGEVEAMEDGCIEIDAALLRLPGNARTFALKVRGESMRGAGIFHGDVVILEFRPAQPGEIVAALIDGENALKRLVTQGGQPFLKAENPNFPALIPARELVIQGVMVALLRISDARFQA
jgi:repressor LexA